MWRNVAPKIQTQGNKMVRILVGIKKLNEKETKSYSNNKEKAFSYYLPSF